MVTKLRTNDDFVRISQFLRTPEFVEFVEGGIVSYGLLTKFVRPPQEQLEAFLRKLSAFWSYDWPRVLTFFVRMPCDLPTACLRPSYDFVVVRLSYGSLTCNSRHSQVVGRKILRLSAHFVGVYNGCRLLLNILCPRITSARNCVEKLDILKMAIMSRRLQLHLLQLQLQDEEEEDDQVVVAAAWLRQRQEELPGGGGGYSRNMVNGGARL